MMSMLQRLHRAIFASPVAKIPTASTPKKKQTPIQRKRAAKRRSK